MAKKHDPESQVRDFGLEKLQEQIEKMEPSSMVTVSTLLGQMMLEMRRTRMEMADLQEVCCMLFQLIHETTQEEDEDGTSPE